MLLPDQSNTSRHRPITWFLHLIHIFEATTMAAPADSTLNFCRTSNLPKPFLIPGPDNQDDAHTSRIYAVRASPNYIVSASADGSVRIWSKRLRSLALPPLLGHERAVLAIEVSEPLDIIFSSDSGGNILLWRLSDGKLLQSVQAHEDSVLKLAWDGRYVVSASRDCTAKIWKFGAVGSAPNIMELKHTLVGHATAVIDVLMADGCAVTSSGDRSVRFWDLDSGVCTRTIEGLASMTRIQIVEGVVGPILVGACTDGNVRVYEIASVDLIACLVGHTNLVRSLKVFRAEGQGCVPWVITSASYDGTVRVWVAESHAMTSWVCANVLSFSDAVVSSFCDLEQELVEEDFVKIRMQEHRVMDMAIDGTGIYCCGEGAEIVGWDFG